MSEQNLKGELLLKSAVKERRKRMTFDMPERLYNQINAYIRYQQSIDDQEKVLDEAAVITECVKKVLARDRNFQDWYNEQSLTALPF